MKQSTDSGIAKQTPSESPGAVEYGTSSPWLPVYWLFGFAAVVALLYTLGQSG